MTDWFKMAFTDTEAVIGAVSGGALGGALGSQTDTNNRLRGGLLGAAGGALVGGYAGEYYDSSRNNYYPILQDTESTALVTGGAGAGIGSLLDKENRLRGALVGGAGGYAAGYAGSEMYNSSIHAESARRAAALKAQYDNGDIERSMRHYYENR